MAWITPVTNRMSPDTRTTATDMNRIAGNLNILTGGSFKDNYTSDDIVKLADWNALIDALRNWNHNITYETTWTNFNLIESTLKTAYTNGLFPAESLYPSETLYPTSE